MTILLAPVATTTSEQITPNLYRKQVLKKGELDYKGRKLVFDEPYFQTLADSFQRRAYDSVPFMLADKDNRHTMEPERAHGEIVALEANEDGLDAILRLSTAAAKIVDENRNFGVSARIVENLQRGDGFTAPAAIQHVLGTWDPRVTGLSPWSAVEMSTADDQEVIDLTETEGETVPGLKLTPEREAKLSRLLDLPEEQFAKLVDAPEDGDSKDTRMINGMSEDEILALLEEPEPDEDTGTDATGADREKAGAALSNETGDDVQLSALREQNATILAELAQERWRRERREMLEDGIPPAMVDLAKPILMADSAVVELSNGDKTNAAEIVRKLLAQAKGTIDLSAPIGHGGADTEENSTHDLHKLADTSGWE